MQEWLTPEQEAEIRREERSLGRFARNIFLLLFFLLILAGSVAQVLLSLR